jgi:peptidoglycan hydrolase-like protein with peptidoglycan-binding domain
MITYSYGFSGPDVSKLQSMLNMIYTDQPLAVDGIFGPFTQSCVVQFQSDKGLAADGIVGPITLQALVAATLGALLL